MSSPAPFMSDMEVPQSAGNPFVDIPARPMRVKVLYTFDNDNKTNCLARFPDVLNIPTVPIDDNTQIGVIELRQCIRAIVGASPELLARLGQGDFTIYAYDYSEYETPLVGQGMLSSLLAAASSTPSAPAHQSKTMITGRVCKNIMGLFSNGVKETLEVKLRLVPVPKAVQNDYVKSMEVYRNLSPATSAGFDPNAWSASLNNNLFLGTPFEHMPSPSTTANNMMEMEMDSHNTRPDSHQRTMSSASFHNGPASRVGTPVQASQGGNAQYAQEYSRPSSRTSVRSEHHSRRRRESLSFHSDVGEQFQQEGPAKKRAKVSQTEWRGKSAFGAKNSDLRVTASTAASIRIHKPVPTRPGAVSSNSLEPPPRAPTPVPQVRGPGGRLQPANFLRRESSLANAQTYTSIYGPPQLHSEPAMSSPEEDNMDETPDRSPTDFPSSPPVMPGPSSPGLPTYTRHADSGYMSGSILECPDEDEDRPIDEEDMQMMAQYRQRQQTAPSEVSFIEQTPGPPELLPSKMNMADFTSGSAQAEISRQRAKNAINIQPPRRGSLALPQQTTVTRPPLQTSLSLPMERPSSPMLPIAPAPSYQASGLNRSYSTMSDLRSEAGSPAPSEVGGPMRSGSGAKRKKMIQDQLTKSIEAGQMPAYCAHCGAIETPTWRNLFTKVAEGDSTKFEIPEVEGVTVGTEVLERDSETGTVTKYRIIKSMRKLRNEVEQFELQGFETLQVCNPCGLWFKKWKEMRPPERWAKKPKDNRKKQQRKSNPPTGPSEPQSDFYVDQPSALYTDAPQPEEDNRVLPQPINSRDKELPTLPAPAQRPRANSMQVQKKQTDTRAQWSGADLDRALHRAIQSSPARFVGTQESPIDLSEELTPKPTRRLLFPSPRKDGEVKSLDDSSIAASKRSDKPIKRSNSDTAAIEVATTMDKENLPPALHDDDDLAHLFEGSPSTLFFKTPSKSTPAKRTPSSSENPFTDLLKTPTPVRSCHRSPNPNAFLPTFSSSETKNLFPPVTPSRMAGSSPSRSGVTMTPFTRHLTQLLSDANETGMLSSPGKGFDFSDLPTFMTPGRTLDFGDGSGMGIFEDLDVEKVRSAMEG